MKTSMTASFIAIVCFLPFAVVKAFAPTPFGAGGRTKVCIVWKLLLVLQKHNVVVLICPILISFLFPLQWFDFHNTTQHITIKKPFSTQVGSAAGAAAGKVFIDLGRDTAKAFQEFGTDSVIDFLKDYFAKGKAIRLDLALQPGQIVYGKDNDELRALGIEFIQIIEGGVFYKYRIAVSVSESMILHFTDNEPDVYKLSCVQLGRHYVDYNSSGPALQSIMIQQTS